MSRTSVDSNGTGFAVPWVLAMLGAAMCVTNDVRAEDEATRQVTATVREMFREIDRNFSDTVDRSEAETFFRKVKAQRGADWDPVEFADHWLEVHDGDANGEVTFEEFLEMAGPSVRKEWFERNPRREIPADDLKLYEGGFSQCSFNALATVRIHFYGPTPKYRRRDAFEQATFRKPLNTAGFGGYFGWGPWLSYMVGSGEVQWGETAVKDLKAENFALRTKALPEVRGRTIVVKYADGEREALQGKLVEQLKRGPVVLWTPYAAVLTRPSTWKHVRHIDANTDIVPFGPFTHAVTLLLKDDGRILVSDGSVPRGIFYTDARTIVATSAAMTAFIRRGPEGQRIIDRIRGVQDEQYNVVFWRAQGEKRR